RKMVKVTSHLVRVERRPDHDLGPLNAHAPNPDHVRTLEDDTAQDLARDLLLLLDHRVQGPGQGGRHGRGHGRSGDTATPGHSLAPPDPGCGDLGQGHGIVAVPRGKGLGVRARVLAAGRDPIQKIESMQESNGGR
ncbi:hypothetical protein OTU49_008912, partial [Cherax quadricarinatus]